MSYVDSNVGGEVDRRVLLTLLLDLCFKQFLKQITKGQIAVYVTAILDTAL